MLPLQAEALLLLSCIVVAGFSANGPTLPVPSLLLSAQTDWLPRSYPSSNRGSDTTVGSWEDLRGLSTSRLEQPHKQERCHTLTQNLKAMGLWVLLLIRCSTFTFSIWCGTHNSHLHTTLPLKCEFIYSPYSPFKRKLLLACIVVVGFSAMDRHKELIPPLLVSSQRIGCLSRTLRRTGLFYQFDGTVVKLE